MNGYDQYRGNLRYAVDIVMCIDATASMGPVLDEVKRSALRFPERLQEDMAQKRKAVSQLRLKVIAFRDFADYADDALQESEFFTMPGEADKFEAFVRGLSPVGGGDVPESGLEALAMAIRAPWERGLDRRRHVIVMFTDAPAHPIGTPEARDAHTYPAGLPRDSDALLEEWGYARSQQALMENSAKRLVLFAPDASPWDGIAEEWNMTILFPSTAGQGLEEFEMGEIINTIANSI
ncbi:vWA domain-containing protein [Actinomadura parmotrematis]|uniref:VWA domain-containing protein n=1 Tax=Actinomadura parmotrematis TaxID=2864039 RepID=A0ABS7G153_9ACTN|nr:vWA domain-containing protein [Actinomadura parmotrematis]MBW8485940.1 VWA domain-containing protein [Actinomadura parmotrematis]